MKLINQKNTITLNPLTIVRLLVITLFILLAANICTIYLTNFRHSNSVSAWYLVYFFDFNNEGNIPTFFSSILLLLASGLLFLIYLQKKYNSDKQKIYWLSLSLLFLFLSFDENVQFHEHIGKWISPFMQNDLSGFLHWSWVVPYFALTLLIVLLFLKFVFNLPPLTRNLFFLSGFIFVSGAMGLELFEGYFYKIYGLDHLYNKLLYCLEELMEMGGVILFIYALLNYSYKNKLTFSFEVPHQEEIGKRE